AKEDSYEYPHGQQSRDNLLGSFGFFPYCRPTPRHRRLKKAIPIKANPRILSIAGSRVETGAVDANSAGLGSSSVPLLPMIPIPGGRVAAIPPLVQSVTQS